MKLLAAILITTMAQIGFASPITLNGAGATFPYPLYSKWFSEYRKKAPDVQVNYNSIGSGGGIRQFADQTVDFGASDAPMTDEQIEKVSGKVVHIPTTLGAVVISYNLGDESSVDLKLTPNLIAEIYLGKIKKWNDPLIQKINPGAKLPDRSIVPVYRSDGSGTTAIFTDYLSKTYPDWKSEVGQGTAVKWKAGIGGRGNEGVTAQIKQTKGTIGYIEFVYAEQNHLPVAAIKNTAGQFVSPSVAAITSAAQGKLKEIPADFRVSITDAGGKKSYPIAGVTYLLVSTELQGEKGKKLLDLLRWIMGPAQQYSAKLSYAPLPKSLIHRVEAKIKTLKVK